MDGNDKRKKEVKETKGKKKIKNRIRDNKKMRL